MSDYDSKVGNNEKENLNEDEIYEYLDDTYPSPLKAASTVGKIYGVAVGAIILSGVVIEKLTDGKAFSGKENSNRSGFVNDKKIDLVGIQTDDSQIVIDSVIVNEKGKTTGYKLDDKTKHSIEGNLKAIGDHINQFIEKSPEKMGQADTIKAQQAIEQTNKASSKFR